MATGFLVPKIDFWEGRFTDFGLCFVYFYNQILKQKDHQKSGETASGGFFFFSGILPVTGGGKQFFPAEKGRGVFCLQRRL